MVSDHNLLLAGIRVKLRKIPKKPVTKRFDIEKLSDLTLRAQYAEHIEKKVDVIRKHQGSAEETWKMIRDTYNTDSGQQ